jgi:hypothetical protein
MCVPVSENWPKDSRFSITVPLNWSTGFLTVVLFAGAAEAKIGAKCSFPLHPKANASYVTFPSITGKSFVMLDPRSLPLSVG